MNATRTIRSERMSRMGLINEPAGYVDGSNLYEYVSGNPIGLLDPMGLQSTAGPNPANGKWPATGPDGLPKPVGTGPVRDTTNSGQTFPQKPIQIETDNGEKVIVWLPGNPNNPENTKTNCHGRTFGGGLPMWINPRDLQKILDSSFNVFPVNSVNDLRPGDAVLYPGQNGPDHSGTVVVVVVPTPGGPRPVLGLDDKDGADPAGISPIFDHPVYGNPSGVARPK